MGAWPVAQGLGIAALLAIVFVDSDLLPVGLAVGLGLSAALGLGTATLAASQRPLLRGTAALLAGLLGAGVAGGLLGGQLTAGQPTWLMVIAGVALVASLAVALVGGYRAFAATPGWWRLVALPMAFVLLEFGVLPVAWAVGGTHAAASPFTTNPPAGTRTVTLSTDDGVRLEAWYTPSGNGAAVILLPGSGGTKAGTLRHAAVLAAHGYGVLALDARGTGKSGGHQMAWGWPGTHDIAAAYAFLEAQPDVEAGRIGAVGLSMGAEQAITAAAEGVALKAVVAEGASARVLADTSFRQLDLRGWIETVMSAEMWALADLMTEAPEPMPLADAVRAMGTRPLLLITSNDPNDAGAGPLLSAAGGDGFQRWDPADTGHTQALARHPGEWEQRVTDFLDQALLAGR